MVPRTAVRGAAMLLGLAGPLLGAPGRVVDSFDSGVAPWSATMQYGPVGNCRAGPGPGANGSGALQVDYALEGPETNHILYVRDVSSDIRRVGFFIWSMGPRRGTVGFDNLACRGAGCAGQDLTAGDHPQRRLAWTGAVSYLVATVAMAVACGGSHAAPLGWREALYGVVGGLAWVATYWFFTLGIRRAGLSIPQCVTWLAVTVPVRAGIMVWGETPTWLQGAGLFLVLAALVLLVAEPPKGSPAPSRWQVPVLVAAFLAEGLNSLAMKGYTMGAPDVDDSGVLLCMLAAAAVGMVCLAGLSESAPGPGEAGHGVVLGAVIAVANPAFMTAMRQLPAPVMFPSFWAGSVVLTALAAMWLWHERYRPRALAGMAIAVAAMVLLNLQAGRAWCRGDPWPGPGGNRRA